MKDFLEFLFASPAHFFGIAAFVFVILLFLDSMVGSIASAFRRNKP